MQLFDFCFVYAAYFSCILALAIAFPVEEQHLSTRDIQCRESKLVVNPNNKATSIKIVTDNGDTLFRIDSMNTQMQDLDNLITYTTLLIFSEEDDVKHRNNSGYFIIKRPLDNGIELCIVDKMRHIIFRKKIGGPKEGLSKTDVKCVHLSGFKVVVEPGLELNKLDGYNMTALMWATLLGQTDVAKDLVEKGAQVNPTGAYKLNSLATAIISGKADMVEYLLNHGAKVNEHKGVHPVSPLHMAAIKGLLPCTKVLLKHGADITSAEEANGATALHFAVKGGHPKVVKELVEKGADVNARTKDGFTPLHIAAANGNEEIVRFLIQSGADLNSKTRNGTTPLMVAVKRSIDEDKLLKIVKHMVEHPNLDLNVKNMESDTAMSLAALQGFKKIQAYLQAHGAQLWAQEEADSLFFKILVIMTSIEVNFPGVEKLLGRENYSQWKFAMRALLTLEGLWDGIVDIEEGKTPNSGKDSKALAKIIQCVDPVNYCHLKNAKTAAERWKNLELAFEDSGLTRRAGLLRKLVTTQLSNCISIDSYCDIIISTAHKLNEMDFEVGDGWVGTLLLAGLPEEFNPKFGDKDNR